MIHRTVLDIIKQIPCGLFYQIFGESMQQAHQGEREELWPSRITYKSPNPISNPTNLIKIECSATSTPNESAGSANTALIMMKEISEEDGILIQKAVDTLKTRHHSQISFEDFRIEIKNQTPFQVSSDLRLHATIRVDEDFKRDANYSDVLQQGTIDINYSMTNSSWRSLLTSLQARQPHVIIETWVLLSNKSSWTFKPSSAYLTKYLAHNNEPMSFVSITSASVSKIFSEESPSAFDVFSLLLTVITKGTLRLETGGLAITVKVSNIFSEQESVKNLRNFVVEKLLKVNGETQKEGKEANKEIKRKVTLRKVDNDKEEEQRQEEETNGRVKGRSITRGLVRKATRLRKNSEDELEVGETEIHSKKFYLEKQKTKTERSDQAQAQKAKESFKVFKKQATLNRPPTPRLEASSPIKGFKRASTSVSGIKHLNAPLGLSSRLKAEKDRSATGSGIGANLNGVAQVENIKETIKTQEQKESKLVRRGTVTRLPNIEIGVTDGPTANGSSQISSDTMPIKKIEEIVPDKTISVLVFGMSGSGKSTMIKVFQRVSSIENQAYLAETKTLLKFAEFSEGLQAQGAQWDLALLVYDLRKRSSFEFCCKELQELKKLMKRGEEAPFVFFGNMANYESEREVTDEEIQEFFNEKPQGRHYKGIAFDGATADKIALGIEELSRVDKEDQGAEEENETEVIIEEQDSSCESENNEKPERVSVHLNLNDGVEVHSVSILPGETSEIMNNSATIEKAKLDSTAMSQSVSTILQEERIDSQANIQVPLEVKTERTPLRRVATKTSRKLDESQPLDSPLLQKVEKLETRVVTQPQEVETERSPLRRVATKTSKKLEESHPQTLENQRPLLEEKAETNLILQTSFEVKIEKTPIRRVATRTSKKLEEVQQEENTVEAPKSENQTQEAPIPIEEEAKEIVEEEPDSNRRSRTKKNTVQKKKFGKKPKEEEDEEEEEEETSKKKKGFRRKTVKKSKEESEEEEEEDSEEDNRRKSPKKKFGKK